MAASNQEIIHAYRHLYRLLLQAVQFARPARFTARDILRTSFRKPHLGYGAVTSTKGTVTTSVPAAEADDAPDGNKVEGEVRSGREFFDAEAIRRTKWFLQAAAAETGLEHRIVKNIVRVRGEEMLARRSFSKQLHDRNMRKHVQKEMDDAKTHYEMTIAMLNHSMGLCLRSGR